MEGIDALEGLLGVRAAVGGRHPAWGTQNALLSLGPQVYLEVMAPDEAPIDGGKPRPFGLDTLKAPRLVTWAVRADNLNRVIKVADGRQVDLGEVREGRRQRPDGVLLQREMTDLTKGSMAGAFRSISIGASPHIRGERTQGLHSARAENLPSRSGSSERALGGLWDRVHCGPWTVGNGSRN